MGTILVILIIVAIVLTVTSSKKSGHAGSAGGTGSPAIHTTPALDEKIIDKAVQWEAIGIGLRASQVRGAYLGLSIGQVNGNGYIEYHHGIFPKDGSVYRFSPIIERIRNSTTASDQERAIKELLAFFGFQYTILRDDIIDYFKESTLIADEGCITIRGGCDIPATFADAYRNRIFSAIQKKWNYLHFETSSDGMSLRLH